MRLAAKSSGSNSQRECSKAPSEDYKIAVSVFVGGAEAAQRFGLAKINFDRR
jgi:hypothetical protein